MLIVYLVSIQIAEEVALPDNDIRIGVLLLAACVDAKYGKSTEEECTTSDK